MFYFYILGIKEFNKSGNMKILKLFYAWRRRRHLANIRSAFAWVTYPADHYSDNEIEIGIIKFASLFSRAGSVSRIYNIEIAPILDYAIDKVLGGIREYTDLRENRLKK